MYWEYRKLPTMTIVTLTLKYFAQLCKFLLYRKPTLWSSMVYVCQIKLNQKHVICFYLNRMDARGVQRRTQFPSRLRFKIFFSFPLYPSRLIIETSFSFMIAAVLIASLPSFLVPSQCTREGTDQKPWAQTQFSKCSKK